MPQESAAAAPHRVDGPKWDRMHPSGGTPCHPVGGRSQGEPLEWVDTGWVSDTLPLSASGGGRIDSEARSRTPERLGPGRPR